MSAISSFISMPRIVLALFSLVTAPAWAGLGAMHLRSAQGAPFVAEIEVTDAKPGEALQASLPGPALQRELALGWSPYYGAIKVEVKARDDGAPYIRLSHPQPFREPFLELAVALEQNGGRSVRAFSAPMPTAVGKAGATIRGTDVELPAAPATTSTPIPAVIAAAEPESQTPAAAAPREDMKTFLARLKQIEEAEAGLTPAKKPAPKPAAAKPADKVPAGKAADAEKVHGFPWLIAGGGLAGVLALGVGGFWIWRRRRARRNEAAATPAVPVTTAMPPDDMDLTAALEPIAETKLSSPVAVGEDGSPETDDALWGDSEPTLAPAEPVPAPAVPAQETMPTQGSVDDAEIDAWFSETTPEPAPQSDAAPEPVEAVPADSVVAAEPVPEEMPAAAVEPPAPAAPGLGQAVEPAEESVTGVDPVDEMFDMLSVEEPAPTEVAPEPVPVPEPAPAPAPATEPASTPAEEERLLEFDFQIEHEPPVTPPAEPAPVVGVPGMALDDMALDLDSVEPDTDDPVTAKLDLARVYLDMGDYEGVREILEEVLKEGTTPQQEEARTLLASVAT